MSGDQAPSSTARVLQILGPGLITSASDDDPSGIATYSQVGAQLGYDMGWVMPIYPNGEMGDTWHLNIDEAKRQATFNAGSAISAWRSVSDEFADALRRGTRLLGT